MSRIETNEIPVSFTQILNTIPHVLREFARRLDAMADMDANSVDEGPLLRTQKLACERVGIGKDKFAKEVAAGRIPCVMVGDMKRYATTDLDKYVRLLERRKGE